MSMMMIRIVYIPAWDSVRLLKVRSSADTTGPNGLSSDMSLPANSNVSFCSIPSLSNQWIIRVCTSTISLMLIVAVMLKSKPATLSPLVVKLIDTTTQGKVKYFK